MHSRTILLHLGKLNHWILSIRFFPENPYLFEKNEFFFSENLDRLSKRNLIWKVLRHYRPKYYKSAPLRSQVRHRNHILLDAETCFKTTTALVRFSSINWFIRRIVDDSKLLSRVSQRHCGESCQSYSVNLKWVLQNLWELGFLDASELQLQWIRIAEMAFQFKLQSIGFHG